MTGHDQDIIRRIWPLDHQTPEARLRDADPYRVVGSHVRDDIECEAEYILFLRQRGWKVNK